MSVLAELSNLFGKVAALIGLACYLRTHSATLLEGTVGSIGHHGKPRCKTSASIGRGQFSSKSDPIPWARLAIEKQ
jgi:hypothetical protein